MTTLNKVSYIIADTLNRSDDYVFVNEIKDLVIGWRAKLIRQDMQRNNISVAFIQHEVLPLIEVTTIDSSILTNTTSIKRTKDVVPTGVRGNLNAPYLYVGEAEFTKPFGYLNQGQVPYIGNRKFTACNVFYSYKQGHIFIHGNKDLDYIGVSGIAENPDEWAALNDACCCIDEGDRNFYLAMDMQDTIVNAIVQSFANSKPNTPDVRH